ncbi:hypothetical protein Sango_1552200 [Sesamum angolense]|uniref:Uncharacterized protein n=1 Tax=Sesamum angolense TaxID=2727404 RepID=A0AAE1WPQ2_9LAMI|nr:hypothetical protein Sango_1552200 [Sesamum angolense]
MVACCTRRTTLMWTTASFMEKLGTRRPRSEILTARRHRMPFLGTCRLPSPTEVVSFRSNCRANDVACQPSDGGGIHVHPSNTEALRYFDQTYSDFARSPKMLDRVCAWMGLHCKGSTVVHLCWPVILTPYNLPPRMCMSFEYMFLTMVIPGDNAKNETFTMRAALMWTVNDISA